MASEMCLGDFKLRAIERIGKGTFGHVFLGRCVCGQFKCIKRVNVQTPKMRNMAEHEIFVTSRLSHPNITRFYRSFAHAGTLNIVLEYVSNTTIRNVIDVRRSTGYIRPTVLMSYFMDILMGLEYLRTQSIIHRDIKPENLLVTRKGNVKIVDFGLSMFHRSEKPHYGFGTLRYMSPEILENRHITFNSDIWSLGCVLHELCSGDHPLGNVTQRKSELQRKIHQLCNPFLRMYRFDMPDGELWADLCESMLTYNSKYRIRVQEILNHDVRIRQGYCVKYRNKQEKLKVAVDRFIE